MGFFSFLAQRRRSADGRYHFCFQWMLLGILLLCFSTDSAGQQLSLSGTVRDADGVVPDATVTLRAAGAEPVMTATDGMGNYNFSNLAPGFYELSVNKSGYGTVTHSLTLSSNSEPVNVTLAVGAISTSITVTDVAGKATASRVDILDRDLPVQVSSIPQQVLQQQGINDMATALRNVSGVQTQRLYGVYEQYTIRGFNAKDVVLVDGLRTEAAYNRWNTQLSQNVETVEVLKGPSSVLYGGEALGGAINIIRKKPQGQRAYDLMYRGGRFNSHQVAGGATGPLIENDLLYRADASWDYSNGWRGAGANRLNVSPSLTWIMGERARLTVHQSFTRDNFKGDGGIPVGLIGTPFFDPDRRYSIPDDFALMMDSQTEVLFNVSLSPNWEFRNGFLFRKTSEEYFITEGVYFEPPDTILREGLYFHHRRHPYVNQAEIVGRVNFLGMNHRLLFGYDHRNFSYWTDVTDDGGFYEHTNLVLPDLVETNPPITSFPIVRKTYNSNRIHAAFWQDHIDVARYLKILIGGRFDNFDRDRYRIFTADPDTRVGVQERHQTAYTYRAGLVFTPVNNHQFYFSSSNSFTPVIDVPSNGAELKPQRGLGYEAGYRWQGWNDRVQASFAFYHAENTNLTFSETLVSAIQAGRATSKGFDMDINADLGHRTRLIVNYGYTVPKFTEFIDPDSGDDFAGNRPRFTQRHALNAWLNKSWASGVNFSVGTRYVGPMFTDNGNTVRLGGWTTFSGVIGYRRERWEWSLNAENLFNRKRYFTPSDYSNQVYPGAPINIFSTIRFRFR